MKKNKYKYIIVCETQDLGFENDVVFRDFIYSYASSKKKAKKIVKEKNKDNGFGSGHLKHYLYYKNKSK